MRGEPGSDEKTPALDPTMLPVGFERSDYTGMAKLMTKAGSLIFETRGIALFCQNVGRELMTAETAIVTASIVTPPG